MSDARELIAEVELLHRTPPDSYDANPTYNECEKDPCAWCEQARKILAAHPETVDEGLCKACGKIPCRGCFTALSESGPGYAEMSVEEAECLRSHGIDPDDVLISEAQVRQRKWVLARDFFDALLKEAESGPAEPVGEDPFVNEAGVRMTVQACPACWSTDGWDKEARWCYDCDLGVPPITGFVYTTPRPAEEPSRDQ